MKQFHVCRLPVFLLIKTIDVWIISIFIDYYFPISNSPIFKHILCIYTQKLTWFKKIYFNVYTWCGVCEERNYRVNKELSVNKKKCYMNINVHFKLEFW